MIDYQCPNCFQLIRIGDDLAGKVARCPHCQSVERVPPQTRGTDDGEEVIRRPRSKSRRRDDDDYDDPALRRRRNEYDDSPEFRCPFCRAKGLPIEKSKVSTAGWIFFWVLFLFMCWPVCWIGLTMKDQYRECNHCGSRIGG